MTHVPNLSITIALHKTCDSLQHLLLQPNGEPFGQTPPLRQKALSLPRFPIVFRQLLMLPATSIQFFYCYL